MIVQVVIISFLFDVDLMCFRFDFFPRVITTSFKSQVPDLKGNSSSTIPTSIWIIFAVSDVANSSQRIIIERSEKSW